jgi:hypothetical protein
LDIDFYMLFDHWFSQWKILASICGTLGWFGIGSFELFFWPQLFIFLRMNRFVGVGIVNAGKRGP